MLYAVVDDWTADQDYASVDIAGTVTAHSAIGAYVSTVDSATHTTSSLICFF